MGATPDQSGYDAKAWIARLREVNRDSKFTSSERALIETRLAALQSDVGKPKPFIEDAA